MQAIKNKGFRRNLTRIIFGTNIIALLLLLSSLLAWYISPAHFILFAYIGMGFPIIIFINVCYLILWIIFLKWKLGLITLVALILSWKPISIYFPIHSKTEIVPNNCIKLLTYNVRIFNFNTTKVPAAENPIFDFVRNSGADIVCFQEFIAGNHSETMPNIEQIKEILKNYPYYSVVNLHPKVKIFTFGIACFSKFPITSTTQIPIKAKDNGSALFTLNIRGKKIALISNHLESNRITSEDKELYSKFLKEKGVNNFETVAKNIKSRLGIAFETRSAQADLVSQYIKNQEKTADGVIVCGDFNDTPISYAYHTVKGDLIDSYAKTGNGVGITYNENHFLFRIDYIMHSKNIKSYNTTVGKIKYSDHYPVWSYLELP